MAKNNASTSRPCCPLVCLVPAFPQSVQAGSAAQPMQMFMVAPMASPLFMSEHESSYAPGQNQMGYDHLALENSPFAWPQQASWQAYSDGSRFGHYAPQELRTAEEEHQDASTCEASAAEHGCACQAGDYFVQPGCSQEEVPTQIQMDSMVFQQQEQQTPSTGTLRRRKGERFSARENNANHTHSCSTDFVLADQELDEQSIDVQARNIAVQMIEQIQAGGDAKRAAVASCEHLAFSSQVTSRAAQIILEETSVTEAAAFATGLCGHVRNAVQSKHANHVVQKITEVMPVSRATFVVEELKGVGYVIARQSFGCRVLLRILEHLSDQDISTLELVEELFVDTQDLCSHPYGSFVARHLLEFGLPTHQHRIVSALRTDLNGFAKHKFGSHVVEAALRHGHADDQQQLVHDLIADKDQLMQLSANQFGRHVVRALLSMPGALKREVAQALRPMQEQLKASRFGKSVLQTLRHVAVV